MILSRALRQHVRRNGFRAKKGADQIGADDTIPFLFFHLFDRAGGENSRVIDKNVQSTEFLKRPGNCCAHRLFVGNVGLHRQRRTAAGDNFFLHRSCCRSIELRDDNLRPFAGHAQSNRSADPLPAP